MSPNACASARMGAVRSAEASRAASRRSLPTSSNSGRHARWSWTSSGCSMARYSRSSSQTSASAGLSAGQDRCLGVLQRGPRGPITPPPPILASGSGCFGPVGAPPGSTPSLPSPSASACCSQASELEPCACTCSQPRDALRAALLTERLLDLREGTPEPPPRDSPGSDSEHQPLSSMVLMESCSVPRLMKLPSRCSTELLLRCSLLTGAVTNPARSAVAFPREMFVGSCRSWVSLKAAFWERRAVLPVLGLSRSSSCLLKMRCMSRALRSLSSSPKGFSSSEAMELRLQKKATCTKVRRPVHNGEVVHTHIRKGLSSQ
mmetsp:Transcript_109159/g.319507  ORF Transcript_109159/g.319507 Transcript_109159/m.319507 type:complete len:319 (+) Transcript_109159:310-1266(+)